MKRMLRYILLSAILLMGGTSVMATEEAAYEVLVTDGKFEVRDYEAHILAETEVEGELTDAGNMAFRPLFRYISGHNEASGKIAMTAPVSQSPSGEKIAMTAPVGQQRSGDKWVVSFMMPASYTLGTLPKPKDAAVKLREVPARRMASVRYSGRWSANRFEQHKQELEDWVKAQGLVPKGDWIWARYNSPMTPWFMRRNEILVEVEAGQAEDVSE